MSPCNGVRQRSPFIDPPDPPELPAPEPEPTPEPPPEPDPLTFDLLTTVDRAVSQPTDRGRCLQGLVGHDGRVFGGYGDWNTNTGPIWIWSYDPGTGLVSDELETNNECVSLIRESGGRLWVPYIDPKPSNGFVASYDGAWTVHNLGVSMWHVFDVLEWGGDIYVAGAIRAGGIDEAAVLRSVDDGATWATAQRFPSNGSETFQRCYWLLDEGATLLTSRWDSAAVATAYHRFDGSEWATSYDPAGVYIGAFRPAIIDGSLTWCTNPPLLCFGRSVFAGADILTNQRAYGPGIAGRMWSINDDHMHELTGDGLAATYPIVGLDGCASAVCELDGYLYVGDTNARLWRAPAPAAP